MLTFKAPFFGMMIWVQALLGAAGLFALATGSAQGADQPRGTPPAASDKPSDKQSPDRQAADKSAPAKPHPDINLPETRQKILDELFTRLAQSKDEEEAKGIAGAIERVWMRSGSDTADLLMGRAVSAIRSKDFNLSIELLDKIVVLDPDWVEAWNKRATSRYFANDYTGAMADIGEVLKREPRHFGALSGMGFILLKSGMERRALEVFRKTLEIYPGLDEIQKQTDQLIPELEGRPI
jgi:tetratricopeptide (TPR) repeat protein